MRLYAPLQSYVNNMKKCETLSLLSQSATVLMECGTLRARCTAEFGYDNLYCVSTVLGSIKYRALFYEETLHWGRAT